MSGLIQTVLRRPHLPEDLTPHTRFYRRFMGWSLFCALLSVAFVCWDAAIPVLAGLGLLVAYGVMVVRGWTLAESDYLSITIGSFVSFVIAGFLVFFGSDMTRTAAFPIGFLIFMVPLPALFTDWFEEFLQHSSADAA